MKMYTCAECQEEVSKRQSLNVPELGGRVCRKHTDVFEELEAQKAAAEQAEADTIQKEKDERTTDAFRRVAIRVANTTRYVAHCKDTKVGDVMLEILAYLFGADETPMKTLLAAWTAENILEFGPLKPEDIPEKTVDYRLQTISLNAAMGVEAYRRNITISDVYFHMLEIREIEHGEVPIHTQYLMAEAYYEAVTSGEVTDSEIAAGLAMVVDLNARHPQKSIINGPR
jgi:hypothetical protein